MNSDVKVEFELVKLRVTRRRFQAEGKNHMRTPCGRREHEVFEESKQGQ